MPTLPSMQDLVNLGCTPSDARTITSADPATVRDVFNQMTAVLNNAKGVNKQFGATVVANLRASSNTGTRRVKTANGTAIEFVDG
jgi:hypothetical protein